MSTAAPRSGLPLRLGDLLAGLRRALGTRAGRDRAFAPIVLLLCHRFSRILARVTAIAARIQAGTLRPSSAARSIQPARSRPPPPLDPLPRQPGWLRHRAPECGAYAEYLRQLLADPELAAIIRAAPQVRRLLRPLWRMLQPEPPPAVLQTAAATAPSPPRRSRPAPRHAPSPPSPARPVWRPAVMCFLPAHRLARPL